MVALSVVRSNSWFSLVTATSSDLFSSPEVSKVASFCVSTAGLLLCSTLSLSSRSRSLCEAVPRAQLALLMIQIQIQIRLWKQVATLTSTALQGAPNTKKKPSSHSLGHRDHEARPHGILVASATTLTSDTAASAPPFHTTTQSEYASKKGRKNHRSLLCDDFGRIQEVSNRCPPLLSSALVRTVLGIFGRSQEVSKCCPPPLSPACVIDRRASVGVRARCHSLEPGRTSLWRSSLSWL